MCVLAGGAAIKKYAVLNNKRHIITKDTESNVAIYDVLKVIKKENLGKVDFDEQLTKLNQRVYIPNWFTVDLKIGVSTQKILIIVRITISFTIYRCQLLCWDKMKLIALQPGYLLRLECPIMPTAALISR